MYTPYYGYSTGQTSPLEAYAGPRAQNYAAPISTPIWVQGEAAARAYMVSAGSTVILMDSEDPVFYLKSTDAAGMPQPLRIFDYTERGGPLANKEYATREEIAELSTRVDEIFARLDAKKEP